MAHVTTTIPALTRRWRLRMALETADLTMAEIADEIGVTRQTVSRWLGDDDAPIRAAYLKQWALRCGVAYDWLVAHTETPPAAAEGAIVRSRRDLNPRPSPCKVPVVARLVPETTANARFRLVGGDLRVVGESTCADEESRAA